MALLLLRQAKYLPIWTYWRLLFALDVMVPILNLKHLLALPYADQSIIVMIAKKPLSSLSLSEKRRLRQNIIYFGLRCGEPFLPSLRMESLSLLKNELSGS